MSIKIYTAYRVPANRLNAFLRICDKQVSNNIKDHIIFIASHIKKKLLDNKTQPENLARYSYFIDQLKKEFFSHYGTILFDLECGWNIFFDEKHVYLIPYGSHQYWNDIKIPSWAKDYSYWDNTDAPDWVETPDVDEDGNFVRPIPESFFAWKEREIKWERLYNKNPGIVSIIYSAAPYFESYVKLSLFDILKEIEQEVEKSKICRVEGCDKKLSKPHNNKTSACKEHFRLFLKKEQ